MSNTYQLTHEGYVIRNGTDKIPTTSTPEAPNTNVDYLEYLDWLAAGGVPEQPELTPAKLAKNNLINTWRLVANRSSFTHAGKAFACDELSRSDIDGITSFVTLAGALPPGWPGGWKAVDNTYHPISTVAEWASFVGSMVAAGNANFAKAQNLKAQLAAATTLDQINAITW